MKAIAAWRVERGADIVILEQLLGSRTIGSTIITLFNLRLYNLSGLLIVLLWVLSPLGGQASLRTPNLISSPTRAPFALSYIDFNSTYNMAFADAHQTYIGIVNTIFTTALIDSAAVKESPQDTWGNIKVPMMESLPGYNGSQSSQWLPVNTTNNVTYSSLVGIPVTPRPDGLNASYSVDTTYMSLSCDDPTTTVLSDGVTETSLRIDPPPGVSVVSSKNLFQFATNTDERNETANGIPNRPRGIYFQTRSTVGPLDAGNNSLTSTICNLTTSNVELNISCTGKTCSTIALRPSQQQHASRIWSPLDGAGGGNGPANSSLIALSFLGDLVNATIPLKYQVSSATEYYLVYPDTPFNNPYANSDTWLDFSNTTTSEFETRLAQLFNSYYLANIIPFAITGDLSTQDWGAVQNDYSFKNATGETMSPRTVFVCNQAWLAVLIISSLAMSFCGLVTAALGILRRGPDILDNFSSLTRDNPYMAKSVPFGGSNIDGISRARYLKDIKVKLGDVAIDDDVGHVAIGTLNTQNIATLRHGRLYD